MKNMIVLFFERSSDFGDIVETISENLTMEQAINVVRSLTGERFDASEVVGVMKKRGSFTAKKQIENFEEDYWKEKGYQILKES